MAGTMATKTWVVTSSNRLNGVRPRWPEQSGVRHARIQGCRVVSMESGLDGRNNYVYCGSIHAQVHRLNGVRPRWPEQLGEWRDQREQSRWVSMESGLDGRNNSPSPSSEFLSSGGLNGVRPRWPEQCVREIHQHAAGCVSMESGLDGRNNSVLATPQVRVTPSQWSPA